MENNQLYELINCTCIVPTVSALLRTIHTAKVPFRSPHILCTHHGYNVPASSLIGIASCLVCIVCSTFNIFEIITGMITQHKTVFEYIRRSDHTMDSRYWKRNSSSCSTPTTTGYRSNRRCAALVAGPAYGIVHIKSTLDITIRYVLIPTDYIYRVAVQENP